MTGKIDTDGRSVSLTRGSERAKKAAGRFGPSLPKINVLGLIAFSKKKMMGGTISISNGDEN